MYGNGNKISQQKNQIPTGSPDARQRKRPEGAYERQAGGRYYQKVNGDFGVKEIQKHLSILQAALKMGCCPQTAKRIFKDRPGVGKYPGKNGRIYYRIPMDVFIRVDQEYRGLVKCAAE